MNRFFFTTVVICALSILCVAQDSTPENTRPILLNSLPFSTIQDAQSALDSFKRDLKPDLKARGFIYAYSGGNSCANEARRIAWLITKYYGQGNNSNLIVAVHGGYRSQATIEFFILAPGDTEPEATPTLEREDVVRLNEEHPQCKQLEEALSMKKGV